MTAEYGDLSSDISQILDSPQIIEVEAILDGYRNSGGKSLTDSEYGYVRYWTLYRAAKRYMREHGIDTSLNSNLREVLGEQEFVEPIRGLKKEDGLYQRALNLDQIAQGKVEVPFSILKGMMKPVPQSNQ